MHIDIRPPQNSTATVRSTTKYLAIIKPDTAAVQSHHAYMIVLIFFCYVANAAEDRKYRTHLKA